MIKKAPLKTFQKAPETNYPAGAQKIRPDGRLYDQAPVIRNPIPVLLKTAGFLAWRSLQTKTPSRRTLPPPAVAAACGLLHLLPRYSDGIVQDLHLFPFYPAAAFTAAAGTVLSMIYMLITARRRRHQAIHFVLQHETQGKTTDTTPIMICISSPKSGTRPDFSCQRFFPRRLKAPLHSA
jgi:hypothetical protein